MHLPKLSDSALKIDAFCSSKIYLERKKKPHKQILSPSYDLHTEIFRGNVACVSAAAFGMHPGKSDGLVGG